MLYIEFLILLSFLVPASIIDCKTKHIPNAISFSFMAIGLIWNIVFDIDNLIFNAIAFLLIFIFGYFRFMGLGDIKMLMGIALFSGWQYALCSLILGSVLLLFYSLVFHFAHLKSAVRGFINALKYKHLYLLRTGKSFPFMIFISIGCIGYYLIDYFSTLV